MHDVLAATTNTQWVLIYLAVALISAAILGATRAAMKWLQSHQTDKRNEDYDQRTLAEFFFDTPRDPRTGTPGKQGWTTTVDNTLKVLADGQARTERAVNKILGEVQQDGNGGHNLRGVVERGAKAAGADVSRIRRNEDQI